MVVELLVDEDREFQTAGAAILKALEYTPVPAAQPVKASLLYCPSFEYCPEKNAHDFVTISYTIKSFKKLRFAAKIQQHAIAVGASRRGASWWANTTLFQAPTRVGRGISIHILHAPDGLRPVHTINKVAENGNKVAGTTLLPFPATLLPVWTGH